MHGAVAFGKDDPVHQASRSPFLLKLACGRIRESSRSAPPCSTASTIPQLEGMKNSHEEKSCPEWEELHYEPLEDGIVLHNSLHLLQTL